MRRRRNEYFVHEVRRGLILKQRLDGPFTNRKKAEAAAERFRERGVGARVLNADGSRPCP